MTRSHRIVEPTKAQVGFDLARLEAAIETAAALVVADDRYAPIFERLVEEADRIKARQNTVSRARAILDAMASTQARCPGTGNASGAMSA